MMPIEFRRVAIAIGSFLFDLPILTRKSIIPASSIVTKNMTTSVNNEEFNIVP